MASVQCHNPCVLCNSQQAIHLINYAVRGQARALVRCRGCGLVRADPLPTQADATAFHDTGEWWFELDESRIPVFDEVLDVVCRYRTSGRFLDVGCGAGTLLARARSRGFDPLGVELSGDACRRARERYGIDARHGSVRQQQFADHRFQVITALEMIDYPDNSIEELSEYRRILVKDGVLVLASRCNRWSWVFGACNAVHCLARGKPLSVGDSVLSHFLGSWGTFTASYQLTSRTLQFLLNRAGWSIRELRNQRTGWSGPQNTGLSAALFSAYRAGCNAFERLTLGRCSFGPKIIVAARPMGRTD